MFFVKQIVDLVFWRVSLHFRHTCHSAEEEVVAYIMTRLKLVNSSNVSIKKIIHLELWRAQVMLKPNLNRARGAHAQTCEFPQSLYQAQIY